MCGQRDNHPDRSGAILELAVPFRGSISNRAIRSGSTSSCSKGETSLDRAPREGIFELVVPSPDFERIMWQV